MIIDSRGKLFGKVSIVDLLIIVIIVAGALGVYYKFVKVDSSGIATTTQKVSVAFFMEDVAEYTADSIKEGDFVRDRTSSVNIGRVTKVVKGPDIVFYPNSDGKVIASSKPGYVSVEVTVEGEGEYSATGVRFNNVDYYVNKSQFFLRVGPAELYPKVSSIKKIEG